MFLGTTLDTTVPNCRIEQRCDPNATTKKCCIYFWNFQSKSEKDKASQSKKVYQSYGKRICRYRSMHLCYHCLESRNITNKSKKDNYDDLRWL